MAPSCPGNAGEAMLAGLLANVRPRVAFGYPFGNLDVARRQPNAIEVAGWTADPDTVAPIAVHIYIDGKGAAITTASIDRPDVGRIYPWLGNRHGFHAVIPVTQAPHVVCAYGISVGNGGNRQLGCAFLPGQTVGSLDTSTRGPGTVNLHGWAIDPDTANSVPIHVYVDGVGTVIATGERRPPDVARFVAGLRERARLRHHRPRHREPDGVRVRDQHAREAERQPSAAPGPVGRRAARSTSGPSERRRRGARCADGRSTPTRGTHRGPRLRGRGRTGHRQGEHQPT